MLELRRAKMPGATHDSEIVFAFDLVAADIGDKASATDIAMAHTMSGYWIAFVQTGDPNGGGRPEWPRYDPASRDVLNFTDTGVKFGADPLKARLDLWRSAWAQRH